MANQIVVSAGAKVRNLNGVLTGTTGVVNSLPINAANGIPQLDVNGKILVSQLPNSVMEYQGTWNAATNTPTLVNGTGNQGDVYLCNVAGTVNFGAGPIAFVVGDQVIYSGSIWQRASGSTGTVTSVAVTESGDSLNITGSPITTSGTINIGFNGTNLQYVNGAGNLTTFPTLITSIGLSMPSAFSVANSPLTANGTIAVTGAGVASQYIRGDGTLASFPTGGGGGSSVSYYLNGGTNQGTFVGNTYYEMSKNAVIGTGVDFTINANGYISQFITDANDPAQLVIPAGNWNFEMYFSASSNGGSPSFYVELYKYNGSTFTLIATSSANPEYITNGTAVDLYTTAVAVPETSLTITDRLAIRVYVLHASKTITLHTQNSHLCEVITTFSTGITALNGLTAQVQYFQTGTSGTDFNISSTTATHTFNIPDASASARGLITTGTQTIAGAKTFSGGITFSSSLITTSNVTFSNSGFTLTLQPPTLSVNRTVTLPNGTGTLALTSDIPTLSGTPPISYVGGVISISQATTSTNGYLSSTDWNTFNGKGSGTVTSVAALTIGTTGTDLSSTVATGTTTPVITLNVPTASATNRGALSSADWSTFNGKQAALTIGNIVSNDTSVMTITGGTGAIIGSGVSLTLLYASGTNAGIVSTTTQTFAGAKTFTSNLQLGTVGLGTSTATPLTINLGSTFSSTAGSNLKLRLFEESGGATYGIGVSGSQMDFNVPSGAIYRFYTGAATFSARINAAGGLTNGILVSGNGGAVTLPTTGLSLNTGYGAGYVTNYTAAGALSDLYYLANTHQFTGAATFSSSVTATGLTATTADPSIIVNQTTQTNNSGFRIQTNGNEIAKITAQGQNGNMNFNIGPSAGWGGYMTFQTDTTTRLTIASTGAATFSSSITTNGGFISIQGAQQNSLWLNQNAGGTSTGFLLGRSYTSSNTQDFFIYDVAAGSRRLEINSSGAAIFISSVTATGFYESSDSRLKTLIQDNYQTKGIGEITPKLYTKNGKVELGYYAQDFIGILDSAVSKGEDDMLSLSYREVLVAKVYALEQRIKELENK